MNAKPAKSETLWVDLDEAPEWTDEMIATADRHRNGVLVSRGRPKMDVHKSKVTIRLDSDIADKLRSNGKGWQTKLNAKLRGLMEEGSI